MFTAPDVVYTPGARLCFDVKKMIIDQIITRDGLHLLKETSSHYVSDITIQRIPMSTDYTLNGDNEYDS